MKLDMETIKGIAESGIYFAATVRAPGGHTTVYLEPDEVVAFVRDRDQAVAEKMAVSKDEYIRWVETDGTPRCGAKTSKGKRCRNSVGGGCQQSLEAYLRLDGGYCGLHGGDSYEEAKAKR